MNDPIPILDPADDPRTPGRIRRAAAWEGLRAGLQAFIIGIVSAVGLGVFLSLTFASGMALLITFGVALVAVPAALFTAWGGYREATETRRRVIGLCPRCGYDLRGSAGRCPECGRKVVRVNVWRREAEDDPEDDDY